MKSYNELNEAQVFSETDSFTVERYQQFFKFLPTCSKTILDIGCNTGRGGSTLKNLSKDLYIIGLDCIEDRLERIPLGIYDSKICSYSTNISLKDSSIDGVVAGEFIEHLYPNDVVQTLKEFYRILRPEGCLLLTTPNPNYLLLTLTGRSVLGGAHVSQHHSADLSRRLEEIGFDDIKVLGSGKVSRFIGYYFPWLRVYGSYLVIANKLK